ncbi:DNA repair protein RecN [Hydrogenivirga sp. 128-5-R1-1]|uniref:DNA repair protein RecN n=1 Tax=Hydrogenivirga sp. 128-5-R1-1 TaxID=392423 RepID=UPI00015F0CF9|nr:DNA repair protein RecN [Hydrogenivirga sp. 128-5-R1-1]EDP75921.1 recombination protein RecN [Hydrogenivirga sp. 128-5-R1-1]
MLRRVSIENFILIKDLEIEFSEGLNIISGETGTGKSMTISALEFVMGRQGDYPEGTAVEVEVGIDGEAVILRREIRSGRSRYFLDGRGTSAKNVREMLDGAVSIQGQNEFVRLLKPEFQIQVLDSFGGLGGLVEKVESLYEEYSSKKRLLDELVSRREELLQKRDFLEFRLKEIEEVGLTPAEVKELRDKAGALKSLEKIKKLVGEALQYLYDSEGSAYSDVGYALRLLWKVRELDPSVENVLEELTLLKDRLLEITDSLRDRDLELSPEEIDCINELLFRVQRLEKKYGKSYEDILRDAEEIKRELASSYGYEDRIEELRDEVGRLEEELLSLSRELSRKRKEKAPELERRIEEVLKELNLEKAKLKVLLERGELSRQGIDRVSFLFSSYGGEPKPVEQVASGGELTRLFLSVALIQPPVATYVFDEVDVGVSGDTSVKLARLLKKLSRDMQVIAITHSAPVCAAGDTNFLTEKRYLGDIPYIQVKKLSKEEKLKEVARLMGTPTENTIRGARELVELVSR